MVNIKTTGGPATSARGQDQSLAQLVQGGSLLPVISGEALEDLVLGGHDLLVGSYADHIGYPLGDRSELHKMVKYRSLTTNWKDRQVKQDYLDMVGNCVYALAGSQSVPADQIEEAVAEAAGLTVTQFAGRLGFPRLDSGSQDPLLILANLPLPVILTTSPYTFLEEALLRAGKEPRTELCRWHAGLNNVPSVFAPNGPGPTYHPSQHEPLVYHLYGLDVYPDSLVLTEDDYLDFLMAVSQGRGKDWGVDPVHDVIKGALQSSALLILGFSLPTWAFRTLYRGLIKPMPEAKLYERYCCVQLVPNEQEKLYLESYLRQDARFDKVYWDEIGTFCQRELRFGALAV